MVDQTVKFWLLTGMLIITIIINIIITLRLNMPWIKFWTEVQIIIVKVSKQFHVVVEVSRCSGRWWRWFELWLRWLHIIVSSDPRTFNLTLINAFSTDFFGLCRCLPVSVCVFGSVSVSVSVFVFVFDLCLCLRSLSLSRCLCACLSLSYSLLLCV